MAPPGRVVIACDKFKGSLTAAEVLDEIRAGIASVDPTCEVSGVLVADGGDGTLTAVQAAGYQFVPVTVSGPTGEPVRSGYALRDGVAVLEMADCCGLGRLPGGRLQALTASSRGLGEMIRAALDDDRVRELVVGVGGSASTDGGAGMLAALGARLVDDHARDLPDGGAALVELASVHLEGLHPRVRHVPITLASDVTNPLLGEQGAVAVFSAQKGADEAAQKRLEAGLSRYAQLVTEATGHDDRDRPGAGAAGGVGYTALAVLQARMRPGVEVVLEIAGFEALLGAADLVITGEGSLDRQTLLGKTPAGVAAVARRHGVPVVAVCGRAGLSESELAAVGIDRVYQLLDLEPDEERCMQDAGRLLTTLAARMCRDRRGSDHGTSA